MNESTVLDAGFGGFGSGHTLLPMDSLLQFTEAAESGINTTSASGSDSAELRCFLQQRAEEVLSDLACPSIFDSVTCWPRTLPATVAILPCMTEFKGVQYDSTKNASRYCNPNGTWDNYTNYDACEHVVTSPLPEFEPTVELPTIVYFVGYSISLAALMLAVTVLVNFKDLRCLRNTIHINLFLTYIMSSSLWMLILSLQMTTKNLDQESVDCIFLAILFHYFSTTNFFWMLVEGLYLYMLVVQTFSGDNLRFRKYAIIGWGGPAIFVGAWALTRPFYLNDATAPELPNKLEIECSWMRESHIDWIIQGPSCAVLVINLIFLLRIMWVLITKLRSANTLETRQYRKASKALLVLIPLLGITYLIVIYGPHEGGVGSHIFAVTRAALLSTQGFVVSLLYCFLNSEVRQTLRHHFYRWRDERNILRPSGAKTGNNQRSKDYSPRSRTESIRTLEYSIVLMKSSAQRN